MQNLDQEIKEKVQEKLIQAIAPLDIAQMDSNAFLGILGGSMPSRWATAKNYPKIREMFGEKIFELLNKKMQKRMTEVFFETGAFYKAEDYWFKMNWINKEIFPWLLMEIYRERWDNTKDRIDRLLNALPVSEREELDPKLQEIIVFIHKNPSVFEKTIHNPKKLEFAEKISKSNEFQELISKNTFVKKIIFSDEVAEIPEAKTVWKIPSRYKEKFDIPEKTKQITIEDPSFYKVLVALSKDKYGEEESPAWIEVDETTAWYAEWRSGSRKTGLKITNEDLNELCQKLKLDPAIISEPDRVNNQSYFALQEKLEKYTSNILRGRNVFHILNSFLFCFVHVSLIICFLVADFSL